MAPVNITIVKGLPVFPSKTLYFKVQDLVLHLSQKKLYAAFQHRTLLTLIGREHMHTYKYIYISARKQIKKKTIWKKGV